MKGNVNEVVGDNDFYNKLQNAGSKLVVVDFSADWCGPCQFIKPIYEQYSIKYPDVVFLSVNESSNRNLIQSLGVSAFPTFYFYINKIKKDMLQGADPNALKNKIEILRQNLFNPFEGGGITLGSSSGLTSEDFRTARLRRFNTNGSTSDKINNNKSLINENNNNLSDEDMLAKALLLSQETTLNSIINKIESNEVICDGNSCTFKKNKVNNEECNNDKIEKILSVHKDLLEQLLEMGFSEIRCKKSILAMSNPDIEKCIHWLDEHQDDIDIDNQIKLSDIRNDIDNDKSKIILTEEEKQKKLEELKEKIKKRRQEKEEEEKQRKIQDEVKRREAGKDIGTAKEEILSIQKKIQYEKRKKELDDKKKEKQRLLMEIEKDKQERKARGGKLTGAFIEYNTNNTESTDSNQENQENLLSNKEKINLYIDKLQKYKIGNAGYVALKTLNVYVKNIIKEPEEIKYRIINLSNENFKKKVATLIGGIAFLLAIGYKKNNEKNTLEMLKEDIDLDLLKYSQDLLNKTIQQYTI